MLNKNEMIEWVKNNITCRNIIPNDEENDDALIYNLVHFILDGKYYQHYDYLPEQDAEIESWNLGSQ
jgi:hypothetical protein